jgi:hypothetical protein
VGGRYASNVVVTLQWTWTQTVRGLKHKVRIGTVSPGYSIVSVPTTWLTSTLFPVQSAWSNHHCCPVNLTWA